MSNPEPIITKKVIIQYHFLGLFAIICYLWLAFSKDTFWEILPVLSTAALCLLAAEIVFGFKRPSWSGTFSVSKNLKHQFIFEFSPYLFTVLVVLLIEVYLLDHPINLILKAVLSILSIGFYLSAAIALEVEYLCIKRPLIKVITNITQIMPAALKIRYFLMLLLFVDWTLFALMALEHFNLLYPMQTNQLEILEILFISFVAIGSTIYLIYLYNRNFIQVIGMQVNALRRVDEGCYDITIPIVSDDELALLAGYHNAMIERLRDRERLYRTLEKSVGANIMKKLLTTDEQTLKQGQAYNVAILFCDLRGFTSLGESSSAEEIILFLNVYFADISSVISEHNGIINKFMGDAVLAIFGLESEGNAVEQAVKAGLAIIQHTSDFYMPNAMHPETGVGIDFGSVLGGTIGSEERFEYTIIGDAVNRANRLESLSKRLGYSMILSQEAYRCLPNDMRENFNNLGDHKVRGRNEPVNIYGNCKKPDRQQSEREN